MWGRSSTRTELAALALAVVLAPSEVSCTRTAPAAPALKVAAAADLAFAFKDVGDAYEKKTGQKVVFSFGSTGLLAKQITEGAPFDVFAAANLSFAEEVVASGACVAGSTQLYARGRIVMWSRDAASAPASLAELKDPRFAKIAIANPEHAPYGRAAKEALIKAGVWEAVSPKLVFGENVQQTLQFAQSGNAEVAIVALSLATVSGGKYEMIDPVNHLALDQALVVCKGSPESKGSLQPVARTFTAFVNSEDGRAIMKRFGFLLPGETLTQTK